MVTVTTGFCDGAHRACSSTVPSIWTPKPSDRVSEHVQSNISEPPAPSFESHAVLSAHVSPARSVIPSPPEPSRPVRATRVGSQARDAAYHTLTKRKPWGEPPCNLPCPSGPSSSQTTAARHAAQRARRPLRGNRRAGGQHGITVSHASGRRQGCTFRDFGIVKPALGTYVSRTRDGVPHHLAYEDHAAG